MNKARVVSYIILAASATITTMMLITSIVLTCIDISKRDLHL